MSRCARLLLLAAAAAVASGARGAELDRTEAFIGYSERTAPPSGAPLALGEPGVSRPYWSGRLLLQRTARLRPWGSATAPSRRHPARGAARRACPPPQAARQALPPGVSRRA